MKKTQKKGNKQILRGLENHLDEYMVRFKDSRTSISKWKYEHPLFYLEGICDYLKNKGHFGDLKGKKVASIVYKGLRYDNDKTSAGIREFFESEGSTFKLIPRECLSEMDFKRLPKGISDKDAQFIEVGNQHYISEIIDFSPDILLATATGEVSYHSSKLYPHRDYGGFGGLGYATASNIPMFMKLLEGMKEDSIQIHCTKTDPETSDNLDTMGYEVIHNYPYSQPHFFEKGEYDVNLLLLRKPNGQKYVT